jgi:hypothetical protein
LRNGAARSHSYDATDRHARRSNERDAWIVEPASAEANLVRSQIRRQVAALAPVAGQHEYRPDLLTDGSYDPHQALVVGPIRRELEQDIGSLEIDGCEGVQTREVCPGLAVEHVQSVFDVWPRRVAQAIDDRLGIGLAIEIRRHECTGECFIALTARMSQTDDWGRAPPTSSVRCS